MQSAHILVDDQGQNVNLLMAPPLELKQMLIDGVGRRQMARVLQHMPEAFGNERIWWRALRIGILSIRDPVRRGCARLLLDSGCWAPARKHLARLRASAKCDFCQAENATLGHQLYDCPFLNSPPYDLDIEAFPDDVLEHRNALRDEGCQNLAADWDTLELSYGLPFYPLSLPSPTECPVPHWGATQREWGAACLH
eukprot:2534943-Pyramimonas_sp.AAC.1